MPATETTTAAAPSPSAPAQAQTAHPSLLSKLAHGGFVLLTKVLPFLLKEAQQSEPLVDLMFPLEGPLYNSVVTAVTLAQVAGASAAANDTTDTGAAKFAAVFTAVAPGLLAEAKSAGLTGDAAEARAKQYVQAVFDILDGPTKAAA